MKQKICRFIFFKLMGWRMIGEAPVDPKFILVAVPHTSNWDLIYGWLAIQTVRLDVKIFAKDSLFIWPIKYLYYAFGIVPVNRRIKMNFVDSVAQELAKTDRLRLFIAPEGTRTFMPTLKSGYYHLAKKANIPIVVAGPNFKDKTFTVMPPRQPLATFAEDQRHVIEFCKTQHAYHPKNTFQ